MWRAPVSLRRVGCVAGSIRPYYHWFNIPASPESEDWDNPLTHLLEVATPDDYVLFKLDIDNNAVRLGAMHDIAVGAVASQRMYNLLWSVGRSITHMCPPPLSSNDSLRRSRKRLYGAC